MLLEEFEELNATSPVRVSGKTPTQIVTGVVMTVLYGAISISISPPSSLSSPSSSSPSSSLFSSVQLKRTRSTGECWIFRSSRSSTTLERRRLLHFEKVTYLRTNCSPQIVLEKVLIAIDALIHAISMYITYGIYLSYIPQTETNY